MLRLFVFIGTLLVLALLAALIAPPFVDWDRYKTRFETEATRIFGQKVIVEGSTSLRLLPLPTITFTDVKFGESADGNPLLLSEKFQMNMELAPLLKGNIVIVDVALEKPQFDLTIDADGQVEWPEFQTSSIKTDLGADDVTLENLSFSKGQLRLKDSRYGREILLNDITGRAMAPSLFGPWNGAITLRHDDELYRVEVSTGMLRGDGGKRLKITLQPQSQPYDVQLVGTLNTAAEISNFVGRLTMRPMSQQSDNDRITFARPTDADGNPEALPLLLESDITIDGSRAIFPAFQFDIGAREDPYVVTGEGTVSFGEKPRFDLRAEGQQFNVENLQTEVTSNADISLAARWETLRQFLASVPRPSMDGALSLYLPAVIAGDTVAREIGVNIEAVGEKSWRIENLKAQLPGRTDLEADGVFTVGQTLLYNGKFLVASRQPSGFAKWVGLENTPEFQRLSAFGFGGFVEALDGNLGLSNAEVFFDQKSLVGRVAIERPDGLRPKLLLHLDGDDVDLDEARIFMQLAGTDNESAILSDYDLDLKLSAKRLVGDGRWSGAEGVELIAQVKADEIVISKFVADQFLDAKLSANGMLLKNSQTSQGQLSFDIFSSDLSKFVSVSVNELGLEPVVPLYAQANDLLKNSQLSGALTSSNDGYIMTSKGTLGGSDVEFSLKGDSVTKPVLGQKIDARLLLVSNEATQLLRQIGLPAVSLVNGGKGALRFAIKGDPSAKAKVEAALTLRDGYLSADGDMSLKDVKPSLDLSVIASAFDLDPLMMMSGVALRGFGQQMQADGSGRWSFENNVHQLSDLKIKVEEAGVQGNLKFDATTQPRPKITGELAGNGLEGLALADALTRPINAETGQSLFSGIDGQIDLTADKLSLSDRVQLDGVKAQLEITDGDLLFNDIEGKAEGASVEGQVRIAQASAKRLASGALQVTDARSEELARIFNLPQRVSGTTDMRASFETSFALESEAMTNLAASGIIAIADPVLRGFNSKALVSILSAADQTEDVDVSEKSDALLQKFLFSNATQFSSAEVPFSISSGTLRSNAIRLSNEQVQLTAAGAFNLSTTELEAKARIEFEPGREAVLGAQPELSVTVTGIGSDLDTTIEAELFGTYLGTRLSERRQREFEAQRAEILARQRLQHLVRQARLQRDGEAIRAREDARVAEIKRLAEEAALTERQRQKRIEAARKAEEEAKRKAEQAAKQEEDRLRREAEERLERLRELEDESLEFLDNEIIR